MISSLKEEKFYHEGIFDNFPLFRYVLGFISKSRLSRNVIKTILPRGYYPKKSLYQLPDQRKIYLPFIQIHFFDHDLHLIAKLVFLLTSLSDDAVIFFIQYIEIIVQIA